MPPDLLNIENLLTHGTSLPLSNPVAIFFTVLAMILIAPLLLQKLRIPNIVGMIVAGIVIGPHCLNLLDRDASFAVFGQVGILYLMFLAGVEIDMLNLRRNWKGGLKFGLLSFLFPLVGGILVSYYVLGLNILTSLLIASMLSSHTLISYPAVARFGLSGERSSVIAVCGTIVSVLLALILLAEVVDIHMSGKIDTLRLLIFIFSIIVYAFGAWWILTWATRWFLRHFNDSVLQYVFILSEMLLSALVAQIIGLEGILGAFYAGLVINRFIPSRSALMSRIEFVGSAIFIPYFLIGVGMMMDVGVIFKGWNVAWIALCMSITALVCKWLATYSAQRMFRLSADDRRLMFGLTSGKAAATIAATILGFSYGLIDEDVMNGSVIMILICCAVASVVTERAAKGLRMAIAERELNNPVNQDEDEGPRQLVAVANPMTSAGLVRLALLMRPADCREHITALFVRSSDDGTITGMGRTSLKDAVKAGLAVDTEIDDVERFDVNPVAGITNVSKERHSTEIVIGLHRRSNVVDTFLGSITEQLLHASNSMIIMSRCFVPLNTLRRVVVVAPPKSEFETGFSMWVRRVAVMAEHIGAKLLFKAHIDTIRYLHQLVDGKYHLDVAYNPTADWDDFIATAADIDDDDDLLIVVSARQGSLSYNSDIEGMPSFLSRYFSRHNLIILYPRQFGATAPFSSMADLGGIARQST